MAINVDAPRNGKESLLLPARTTTVSGPQEDGLVWSRLSRVLFATREVGFEPIPGTEDRFRLIPLDDAELEEVIVGLYTVDWIVGVAFQAFCTATTIARCYRALLPTRRCRRNTGAGLAS